MIMNLNFIVSNLYVIQATFLVKYIKLLVITLLLFFNVF